MEIFVLLLKDHPTLPPWQGQSVLLGFLDPYLCLCSTYRLQPFMGSTAPFRGRFKVMMRATGQVTMSTSDMRMARTGTKTIPRRTHCVERDTRTRPRTHTHTQCKAGCKEVKPFCSHCYLQKLACFSAPFAGKHTKALVLCRAHKRPLQADFYNAVGDYGPARQCVRVWRRNLA